jgi:uncharacterized protein (DUF433 family)
MHLLRRSAQDRSLLFADFFDTIQTMEGELIRITIDPAQMGGVPCIRHLRIPIATILRQLANGMSEGEILVQYPDLEVADIRASLSFAALIADEREISLPQSA